MSKAKRKLLVTASTFPRWSSDTEPRFVLDISKALTEFYDVTVLAPASAGAEEEEEIEGVKVLRYHYFPIHKWETLCYPGAIVPRIKEKKIRILLVPFLFIGLWNKLRKVQKNFDLIHAHWLIPQGIVQSFFKKPYIVTGHGGDITSLNAGIIKKLKTRCLKKAKNITVVSEALKKQVENLVPQKKIEVISMGCDTSKFGKQYFKTNLFNQGDKKVVLFVGRLAEVKGVTYLIEAMRYVEAKLVITGTGPLEQELRHQAEEFGDKITFLGPKTHKELAEIYASADVFVAPSVTAKDGGKEGLGLVLLEAMASGLPVVGSNSGGIPEIIKDNYNGFLVEERDVKGLAEKITEILESEELRKRFSDHGHLTALERDYKKIAEKYYDLLEE